MPDLFVNFAFAATTAAIIATDTTVSVDDVSSLPSNTALSAADFWMVFESTLTHPNSFEIVKVASISGTTLTIQRGQEGTTATSHASGTVMKGVLTAATLNRGVLSSRAAAVVTTSSLASNATDSSTAMPLGRGYALYAVKTSVPARVRLYTTAAAQTADLSRQTGTDPSASAGVVLDYVTAVGNTTYSLSPVVQGANLESTPTSNLSMSVTNLSGSTSTVTVTLTWVREE